MTNPHYDEVKRVFRLHEEEIFGYAGVVGVAPCGGSELAASETGDERALENHIVVYVIDDQVAGIPVEIDGIPIVKFVSGEFVPA